MQSNANNWSFNKIIAVSVATGVVVLLFLLVLLAFAFWGALFWGAIVGGIVFLILWLNFGSDEEEASGTGTGSGAGSAVATPSAGAATGSDTTVGHSGAATASAAGVGVVSTSAADVAVDSGAETESSEAAEDVTETGSAMKPSKELPGQAELAARKGEWKYSDAGAGDSGAATEAAAADADLGEDYDKDGVREGTDEGAKPVMLTEARVGGADNLKEIKGVGPKMEQMLNGMGVYHFDQIAAWTANEVAWVDANLKGFKGRVSRDGWVDQAKVLMTGAETEFSQRVEDGKVY